MKLRCCFFFIMAALCLSAVSCGKKGDPFLPAKQGSEVRARENPGPPAREEREEESEAPKRK